MLLLIVLGPVLLPEFRDPGAGRLDLISAALSLGGVLSVIYGLKRVAETARPWPGILFVIVGVGTAVVFVVRRQRALPHPLLDLGLFRSRAFTTALATYSLGTFVAFGVYVFIGQYLQLVVGLSPLKAGLWTAPFALAFIVGSLVDSGHRPSRLPPLGDDRWPLTGGGRGFGVVALVDSTSGLGLLVTGLVAYSLGLAPVFTLSNDVVIGCAPPEHAGGGGGALRDGLGAGGSARHRPLGEPRHGPLPGQDERCRPCRGSPRTRWRQLVTRWALPSQSGGSCPIGWVESSISRAQEAFIGSLRLSAFVSAVIVAGVALATALVPDADSSSHPNAQP